MEFSEVVRRRRMVRSFDPERAVDEAVVRRMLEHATRAPSAGFSQGWAFLVLDTPADRERFWTSTGITGEEDNRWLRGMRSAPLLIVALSSKEAYLDRYAEDDKGWSDRDEARWPVPYWDVDTGMASLLILQTAVDEGLGACFFGIPADTVGAFAAEFGVPGTHRPVGAIAIGHPAAGGARGSAARRTRRRLDDVVHRGSW
ncbi:hypothetical protein GCM10011519_19250 [Marmoricola endophyticus]|uniref:Nitroreductase domain-containing protein n=1 Tax=Marmoricola endophyticus TaxID=2040280 RepID=A0A917BHF9_9ACTN|nr:nitroreductase family protein [Marmoricola endophyticus]GGF45499.1 hypothetical protein GCM10011519_19250 [Marmoricola endophyticus]